MTRRVVTETTPSGTYHQASRREPDGAVVVGPSASTPEAALLELDRDAGGLLTRARAPIPGEPRFVPHEPVLRGLRRHVPQILLVLMLTLSLGCATLTPTEALDASREGLVHARQALDGAAVLLATARAHCDAQREPPEPCAVLRDVDLEPARDALQHAEAAQQGAEDALRQVAPLVDAARAVLAEAP